MNIVLRTCFQVRSFSILDNFSKKEYNYIVEGLVELTKWLVSEGLKKLISLIPAVGALLGFFLGKLISIALDAILSTKFVKSIRDKFQKKVNAKTYKVWDYLVTYFKCWA